jgi:porin
MLCLQPLAAAGETEVQKASSENEEWKWKSRLDAAGVGPFAVVTVEAWHNAAGGIQRTTWANSLVDFGLELDTEKLGGWAGGTFLAQVHWVSNSRATETFSDATGTFNPVSSIFAEDHLRVYNLFYRHTWGEEKVVLKVGQLAADDDFMISEYAALFLNSAFGAMPSQVGRRLAEECCGPSTPFPIYPVAAPGAFTRAQLLESLHVQLGLYYGAPGLDVKSNYGFHWAERTAPEIGAFLETDYSFTLAGRKAMLRAGGAVHSGEIEHFAAIEAGDKPASRHAVPSVYLVHDLELLTRRGAPLLGLFLRLGVMPELDATVVDAYADGGLNWFGPVPARPQDTAGVAVSWTHFGRDFKRSQIGSGMAADETALELTYRLQFTPRLSLQGDLQYVIGPLPTENSGRENALVLGVRGRFAF